MPIHHLKDTVKRCVLYLFLFALGATSAPAQPLAPDSVTLAIAPEYDAVSRAHRFWFGENYRALWATPVQMRVFHLSQEKGGMKILKKGGGQQTRSLRLQDAAGNEWVLRTVQKDPGLALPENLRATVAKAIVQDQISASHPFASLVVPPLAEALNVPHANPEIVYLPDDPALGEYRREYANQVYLFEEREPLTARDTDNTEKVLEKLEDDNDNRVDQRLVLRARLLDLVIGDWDRHADQWRWVETEDEVGDMYRPVPRDRDQVFFVNTGVIPSIASRKWIMPKFQGYDKKIRDVKGLNFNARYFDRLFLQSLDEEAWREEIGLVQQTLTDSLVYEAVHRMPAGIYALSGDKIARTMIARRDNLEKVALDYYRFLAKTVDIPISDKRERVDINYTQADGSVAVTVHDLKKDDSNGRLLYHRTFLPSVTKEIRVYGRGGGDIFSVAGKEHSPIKVRVIGGGGKDDFRVEEGFRNSGRLLLYDRSDKENTFPKASLATIKASADTTVNDYEPNTYQYDILMPQVTAGYNLDDGVLLGAGFLYTKHGFRKEPYAARHRLMAGHALATKAFFFDYSGEFTDAIGKANLTVDVNGKAPNNTSNFFGVGNETEYVEVGDKPIRFYRTRYDFITSQVRLHRSLGEHFSINGGVAAQYYSNEADENNGRFIISYQEENPSEAIFSRKFFTGLVAGLEYDTRNNSLLPSRGVHWSTSLTGMQQLDDNREAYGQVQSAFSFYLSPGSSGNLVIANRFGGGATVGEPNFYQLLYLGGSNNLRGFRNYRFAGERMLYHNLELRLKLFDFSSYLFPGSVGLLGFNDVGRVWVKGEDSDKWHDGFGGGLYLIPAKLILLQGVIGISEDDVLPHVSVGFRF
ncbi:outer membrane protein assembly factor [Pontibacter sp. E15-1]|uniref:BamA/TamA family outer membrane protein n=1 Tax=Pontibacter sp. E15-1 TaxID=2919918 RepID=UPI001F4FF79D|nr:BamA/TamA family outer membrane protein [Pontibacter sp. E15-1]MCJ8163453.1 outer membrane protein assembly factor [Pontibacter sp. E15-1]